MRRFQVLIDISAGRILETSVDPNLFRLDKEFRRTIPFIDIKSVRPIKPNEWELCAVDFHVSSIIDMWKSRLKPDHVKQYQTGNIFSAFPSSKNIMGSGVGVTANSTAGMRKNGVDLNDILTRIMWKYGSGLNVKREIVVMGLDYVPTRVSSSSSSFSLLPFAGEDVQSPDIHDKWKRAFYEEYLPVLNELARSIIQRYVE